jgi:hypothetical protein
VDTSVSEIHVISIFRAKDRRKQYVPPKRWYLSTDPHGVATQMINIDVDIFLLYFVKHIP